MVRLVPLDPPEMLNIPCFAMGAPGARREWAEASDLQAAVERWLGRRARQWLAAHVGAASVWAMRTRTVKPPKTAVYTEWLCFSRSADAARFLAAFPKFDAQRATRELQNRRRHLTAEIEMRLARGDFDLGRYGHAHRYDLASRYQQKADDLRGIDDAIAEIARVQAEARRWASSTDRPAIRSPR